jgi:4-amino-4-deoxy-L-arabinose transferase-like glycosyltransferase
MSTVAAAPAGAEIDRPSIRDRSLGARLLRGREADPRWVRPALLAVLALTALLYVVDLSASGYANSFYAAAVQAGTKSWKAFFFGSFDSSNFITVDKPPASLWVMELFARAFGFSSWSLLVPQALEGVATVGLVYATVRRRFSAAAGLLAAFAMALTPVAVLMFRYDNPDALLVLLMTLAAYAVIRGMETAVTRSGTRWLLLAGTAVGLAFLTKTLQAFLVLPGFALVIVLLTAASWRRRLWLLLAGGLGLVVSAGWWIATVSLWPAASRPYIGGSQNNSEWNLIFGYNGIGRLTGNETGSVGGRPAAGGGGGIWGSTGIFRLLGSDMGSQISWLLPTALILAATLLWLWRRAPLVDARRSQVLLWVGWLVVTALTFSFAKGIIHPYYTVALAPPIAALTGIGAVELWWRRGSLEVRIVSVVTLAVTALWADDLLDRSPTWHPWLRIVVLLAGLAAAVGIIVRPRIRGAAAVTAALTMVTVLAGPAAYAADTASAAASGAIPSAGPAVTSSDFLASAGSSSAAGRPGVGGIPGVSRAGGGPGALNGRPPLPGGMPTAGGRFGSPPTSPLGAPGGLLGAPGPGATGAAGGLLGSGTVSTGLAALLKEGAASYTWIAAAVGANSAAGFQLATSEPVMAIGGFNGTDPDPTLKEFEQYVSEGRVHYFIAGGAGRTGGSGGPGQPAGSSNSNAIATWVEAHFTSRTVDGVTLYDLTRRS